MAYQRAYVIVAGKVPSDQAARIAAHFPGIRVDAVTERDPIPEHAADADVLWVAGLSREALRALLARLPGVRWIHSASSGLDRLLVPEIVERGLQVTRTANARAVTMAEFVVAVTLALMKRLPELLESQRVGRWERVAPATLAGSCVGIIGAGTVGRAAAARFRAFGTRTIGLKRRPVSLPEFDEVWGPDRLEEVLRASDVLLLSCPLSPETHHMIDRERLASMKRTSILVNVSRGQVIVQADLIAALRRGEIGGAALDVFEQEPLPARSPLWSQPNVIVSPHCSSAGPEVWSAVTDEFLANLERYLNGSPLAHAWGATDHEP